MNKECSICNAPMVFVSKRYQFTKTYNNKYKIEKWECNICDRTEEFYFNRNREEGHITEGKNMIQAMYKEQENNN